jgi:hypothetical protein
MYYLTTGLIDAIGYKLLSIYVTRGRHWHRFFQNGGSSKQKMHEEVEPSTSATHSRSNTTEPKRTYYMLIQECARIFTLLLTLNSNISDFFLNGIREFLGWKREFRFLVKFQKFWPRKKKPCRGRVSTRGERERAKRVRVYVALSSTGCSPAYAHPYTPTRVRMIAKTLSSIERSDPALPLLTSVWRA